MCLSHVDVFSLSFPLLPPSHSLEINGGGGEEQDEFLQQYIEIFTQVRPGGKNPLSFPIFPNYAGLDTNLRLAKVRVIAI